MTINTAIEKLLEISQAREESDEYFECSHHSRHGFHIHVWNLICILPYLPETYSNWK